VGKAEGIPTYYLSRRRLFLLWVLLLGALFFWNSHIMSDGSWSKKLRKKLIFVCNDLEFIIGDAGF
jgi:hypothetical protein